MPYRRKGSRYWWISYTVGGRQVRESSGTASHREAKTLEAQKRAEAGKRGPAPRYEFDKMMDRYLAEIEGEAHYDRAVWAVSALTPYFTGRAVDEITVEDLMAYRHHRNRSDGTIIKELGVLSSACNRAIRAWGWRMANPVQWFPKAPQGRLRWLRKPEARKLIKAAEKSTQAPYLADMIRLALATGMRKGEILGLTWDRVDLRRRLIYLAPEHQKSGRHGSVALNQDAVDALKAQKGRHKQYVFVHDGEPIADVKRSFRTACDKAGIEDFHFHDLRHTFAAWLVQAGVSIREVADLLRHSSIQTTMRYAHLAPENLRKAVNSIRL